MADVATTPAATDSAANADKKKPEKPDQHLFDERVAKAEKEYQDAMNRYVRRTCHFEASM